jgi:putative protease
VSEIADLGVDSLKIEGRLKRPEYVGAAVSCVKGARDGNESSDLSEKLRAVFSRSGFTSGYFDNNRSRDMFGTRKKEDVTAASSEVLKKLALLLTSFVALKKNIENNIINSTVATSTSV